MKLAFALLLLATPAWSQALPIPGPGKISVPPCTPNNINGSFADITHLFHFDNSGTDSSGNGHTLTLYGSAAYSPTSPKFGTHSLKGNVAGGGANIGGTWSSYTQGITLEYFLNFSTNSIFQFIGGDFSTTFGFSSMILSYDSAGPQMASGGSSSGGTTTAAVTAPVVGQWHHYAWVRNNAATTVTFYIDGVSQPVGGVAWTGPVGAGSNGLPALFSNTQGGGSNYQGFMDEMRISKVQRYTGNFTPPTAPFCDF